MSGVCAAYAGAERHTVNLTLRCPTCGAPAYAAIAVATRSFKPLRDPKVEQLRQSPGCTCAVRDELVRIALDRLVAETPA